MTDKLSEWLRDKISMGELPDTEEMADAVFTAVALEQRVKRYETTLKEIDASFHESARVLSHIGRVTVNALAETEREALAEEEA